MSESVVILSAARTAIGSFNGSLSGLAPTHLGAEVAREAIARADIEADEIEQVVFGNIIHTEARDMYLSRVAAIEAGVPVETPALTLNRLCGSGLQAIVSAAQAVMLGDTECVLAGGAESMSRSPHATRSIRTGQRLGDVEVTDMMIGVLTDPFGAGHMGVTAENVAREHGISRAEQDSFAVTSHRRAAAAIEEGRFREQIVPLEVKDRIGTRTFDTDEHVRHDVNEADLEALRPIFQKDGSVTAGNSSGISDGAAAVVMMSESKAQNRGLKPMARILGYAHAGVRPETMGLGPIPAVRNLLTRTGLALNDFDVIESNEAFAAQACAVSKELGMNPDVVNKNGGAIALGHPVGATGAILTVKAIYELRRANGRYGLITLCIGGGQGIAMAIERLEH